VDRLQPLRDAQRAASPARRQNRFAARIILRAFAEWQAGWQLAAAAHDARLDAGILTLR